MKAISFGLTKSSLHNILTAELTKRDRDFSVKIDFPETQDEPDIEFSVVRQLVEKLPADIEITFVGGQAVTFWSTYYREIFPEEFEGDPRLVFGTKDIDIKASSDAARKCAEAWGGEAIFPSPDHLNSPNSAIVKVEIKEIGEIAIDFVAEYLHPENIRSKFLESVRLSASRPVYILGVIAVLASKIANVTILRRADPNGLGQLRVAVILARCLVMEAMQNGDMRLAGRIIMQLIFMAKDQHIGRKLYSRHGIDLLDTLPRDLSGLDQRFIDNQILPGISEIKAFRDRHPQLAGKVTI